VSIGLATAGRFPVRDLVPYIVAQVIGATLGAWVIYLIATGNPSFDFTSSGFAANGFGEHSPGHFSMVAALVCEVAMTFFFLFVILGATVPDAHPPDLDSGHQYVGESGALVEPGVLRRRLGARSTVDVLDRADRRCDSRGPAVSGSDAPEVSVGGK
jgi:glycerol uptake facilitator-like aquaporin